MEDLMARYDEVDQIYRGLQRDPRFKRSNVPVGMTLNYRIWEITQAGKTEAEVRYQAARKAMGEKEYAGRFAAGELSVGEYEKSAHYRAIVMNYIKYQGKLNKTELLAFHDASDEIIIRVLRETDITVHHVQQFRWQAARKWRHL